MSMSNYLHCSVQKVVKHIRMTLRNDASQKVFRMTLYKNETIMIIFFLY